MLCLPHGGRAPGPTSVPRQVLHSPQGLVMRPSPTLPGGQSHPPALALWPGSPRAATWDGRTPQAHRHLGGLSAPARVSSSGEPPQTAGVGELESPCVPTPGTPTAGLSEGAHSPSLRMHTAHTVEQPSTLESSPPTVPWRAAFPPGPWRAPASPSTLESSFPPRVPWRAYPSAPCRAPSSRLLPEPPSLPGAGPEDAAVPGAHQTWFQNRQLKHSGRTRSPACPSLGRSVRPWLSVPLPLPWAAACSCCTLGPPCLGPGAGTVSWLLLGPCQVEQSLPALAWDLSCRRTRWAPCVLPETGDAL